MTLTAATNPRFLAFARSEGRDPDTMQGGAWNAAYIRWIGEAWMTWCTETGVPRDALKTDAQHAEFDRWLAGREA